MIQEDISIPAEKADRVYRYLFLPAVSVVFTMIILNYSQLFGRLSVSITYDDVNYFNDALWRLNRLYTEGVAGFFRSFSERPMHSPLSTCAAMSGFIIFGIKDWAPYAVNAFFVYISLFIVDRIVRNGSVWTRCAATLFTLSVPFIGMSVHEFRPDLPAGLLTAAAVFFLLVPDLTKKTGWKKHAFCGLLFGLALLSKPSIFPLTLFHMGTALLFAAFKEVFIAKTIRWYDVLLKKWSVCLFTALIIFFPHIFLSHEHYKSYIFDNTFGADSFIWKYRGDFFQHLLYYLTGIGGEILIGRHLVLFAIVLVTGWIGCLSNKEKRGDCFSAGFLFVLLIISYLAIASIEMKSFFFAGTFCYLLLFSFFFCVRCILSVDRRPRMFFEKLFLMGLVFSACFLFKFPMPHSIPETLVGKFTSWNSEYTRKLNQIENEIYRDIMNTGVNKTSRIFFTYSGVMDAVSMRYRFLKDGYFYVKVWNGKNEIDLNQFTKAFEEADFVVAGESQGAYNYPWHPSATLGNLTLELIRKREDFLLIDEYVGLNEKSYFLFRKLEGFWGWKKTENLFRLEGPYPKQKLGKVRWGLGPSTKIYFEKKRSGTTSFFMEARRGLAGQKIRILLDGREIGRKVFETAGQFERMQLNFPLSSGSHLIELEYGKWSDPSKSNKDKRPLAVLFKSLAVCELPSK